MPFFPQIKNIPSLSVSIDVTNAVRVKRFQVKRIQYTAFFPGNVHFRSTKSERNILYDHKDEKRNQPGIGDKSDINDINNHSNIGS